MPKVKSHSGTKSRMKVTKKGKVLARKSNSNHFMQKKSSSRKRTFAGYKQIGGKTSKTIKRNLGA